MTGERRALQQALGQVLTEMLQEQGMSRAELARRTNLTKAAVQNYQHGRRAPRTPDGLDVIARGLGETPCAFRQRIEDAGGLLP